MLNVKEIQIIVLNYKLSCFITSGSNGDMAGLRDAKQLREFVSRLCLFLLKFGGSVLTIPDPVLNEIAY